jgi:hypothetical protein
MDNFFKQCPPKMEDGRLFLDARSAVRREEYIKFINNIVRDDDHRLFYQKNADTIMDREWKYLKENKYCRLKECVHTYPTRVYPPWFVEERRKYDSLKNPARVMKYECPTVGDYRLTMTTSMTKNN